MPRYPTPGVVEQDVGQAKRSPPPRSNNPIDIGAFGHIARDGDRLSCPLAPLPARLRGSASAEVKIHQHHLGALPRE